MSERRQDPIQSIFIVALIAGIGYLLYLLAPILTPFLVSALLAYMADPIVDRLEKWRLPRTVAVLVVFLVIVLLVLLVVLVLFPIFQRQVIGFVPKIPGYIDWFQNHAIPWIQQRLGQELPALNTDILKQQLMKHWQELGNWAGVVITQVSQSGIRLLGWLLGLALIPIVTFYLLRDWDIIVQRVVLLIPPKHRAGVKRFALETDDVLASFFRGQLLVMLALAIIYSLGLSILGLDLALPIGIAAGFISFVPYLGFIVGLITATIAVLFQFQDSTMLLWVLVIFLSGQLIESFVLTPRLLGARIGLHPVAVIFAAMAGGQLFGFFGVLLALPVAAVLKVFLRQVLQHYRHDKKPRNRKKRLRNRPSRQRV